MTTIRAHFDGRVFVPDGPVNLPVDTPVEVSAAPAKPDPTPPADSPLSDIAEIATMFPPNPDSPPDRAAQHEHYLYGQPKQS